MCSMNISSAQDSTGLYRVIRSGLPNHDRHDDIVFDFVTVDEQVVLELLAHAEETNQLWLSVGRMSVDVLLFNFQDCILVFHGQ